MFPAEDGSPRKPQCNRALQRAMDRAGLNSPHMVKRHGKATPHTLRHTYASKLVQRGMSLYAVQHMLGHASPTTTKRYAALAPDMVADEAAALLDGIEHGRDSPVPGFVKLGAPVDDSDFHNDSSEIGWRPHGDAAVGNRSCRSWWSSNVIRFRSSASARHPTITPRCPAPARPPDRTAPGEGIGHRSGPRCSSGRSRCRKAPGRVWTAGSVP